jgi:Tol biopolymer transport system component
MILDTDNGKMQAVMNEQGIDSHFLAWSRDGHKLFARVDSMGNPRIMSFDPTTDSAKQVPIAAYTYDLAPAPGDDSAFTFSFSRGLGTGSEIWLAQNNGNVVTHLLSDPENIIGFARWSPDGRQIAFIKIPDSQIPFTVGGLWVMNADGSNPRMLAEADAGHGYEANWSPDGARLAFVVRENPGDSNANQSDAALLSNVYIVNVASGEKKQISHISGGRAETPIWSSDGNLLAFNTVVNGRMETQVMDSVSGAEKPVLTEPVCCLIWMRK